MDLLPLHIEYLLTRHDCVIVPQLGAFIATEREAYIDFETGMICPRRREISFNGSVVTDDGLLSHSIARREGLPYEDARRLVSHLAGKLSDDLREEGEVSMGMIGKLVIDEEGLINFMPRRSAILSDIRQDVKLHARPVTEAAEDCGQTVEPLKETPDEEDGMRTIRVKADRYVFTVSKRAVHAAAMLVAVFTIALSLLLPINHDNEQKASVISFDEFFHRQAASVVSTVPCATSTDSDALKDSVVSTVPVRPTQTPMP
ncbi:MAG: hypothetical protein K2H38_11765 [Muribaculaceae bacterium]|nr:hypothetical protein [Muribaculaceae bacterium]